MLTSTFSIVGLDRRTGEIGIAVASKALAVGAVVPWAQAGVGGVATQAWTNQAYGPNGLRLLADGLSPDLVIDRLVSQDEHRDRRQLGVVDASGRAAAWTGQRCTPWAGHRTGSGYTCQGNLLASSDVVDAMGEAFEKREGPLPERLLAALEVGQSRGGDKRGQQAAALLVTPEAGTSASDLDRPVNLRVDDAAFPIVELRRLLELHRRLRPGQKLIDEFVSAARADLGKVKVLLKGHPVLVQQRASWDETALEAATRAGEAAIAEFLISNGATRDT